jgi:hypothetical protein
MFVPDSGQLAEVPPTANTLIGQGVAISGEHMVGGGAGPNTTPGRAVLWRKVAGTWTYQETLASPNPEADGHFGVRVDIDGTWMAIGASNESALNTDSGRVYMYQWNGSNWVLYETLDGGDAIAGGSFGNFVDLDGTRLAVGATHRSAPNNLGYAYVYDFNGTNWVLTQRLEASVRVIGDRFGRWLSLDGDRLAVGSSRDDSGFVNNGAVHVFDFDGMTWTETQTILPGDLSTNKRFYTAALLGDQLVIGAEGDNQFGSGAGAAYYFTFDGITWTQQTKFAPATISAGDAFGNSIDRQNDIIVIGAPREDDVLTDVGAAYVFELDTGVWVEKQRVLVAAAGMGDELFFVSLDFPQLATGSCCADPGGQTDAGAVYVFKNMCP